MKASNMSLCTKKNKVIAITGFKGFVGSVLTQYYSDLGYEIYGIDTKLSPDSDYGKTDYTLYHLRNLYLDNQLLGIVHLGAHSLLGPSVKDPLKYFDNNVSKSTTFLQSLIRNGLDVPVIFASSAAVYGNERESDGRIYEHSTLTHPVNPYGWSKIHFERVLEETHKAYGVKSNWVSMRLFNVVGGFKNITQGLDQPHIIPSLLRALGTGKSFKINGDDYQTDDGTCIRDYLHIVDLADHILETLTSDQVGLYYHENCGSGKGTSNWELFQAFEGVFDRMMPVEFGDRKPGDPDKLIAAESIATKRSDIENILRDVKETIRG